MKRTREIPPDDWALFVTRPHAAGIRYAKRRGWTAAELRAFKRNTRHVARFLRREYRAAVTSNDHLFRAVIEHERRRYRAWTVKRLRR